MYSNLQHYTSSALNFVIKLFHYTSFLNFIISLKSTIVPLFEKVLSASDAGRIGRLVLPKSCAEVSLHSFNNFCLYLFVCAHVYACSSCTMFSIKETLPPSNCSTSNLIICT